MRGPLCLREGTSFKDTTVIRINCWLLFEADQSIDNKMVSRCGTLKTNLSGVFYTLILVIMRRVKLLAHTRRYNEADLTKTNLLPSIYLRQWCITIVAYLKLLARCITFSVGARDLQVAFMLLILVARFIVVPTGTTYSHIYRWYTCNEIRWYVRKKYTIINIMIQQAERVIENNHIS